MFPVLVGCLAFLQVEGAFLHRLVPELPVPKVPDVLVPKVPDIPIPKVIPDISFPKIPDIVPSFPIDIDEIPIPNPLHVIFVNKCIEDLGCFYTGPPFYHPINRPIPLPPTNYQTLFLLYTPANPADEYLLERTKESVVESPFEDYLPTKILIHGFRSDLDVDDIRFKLKDKLLNYSNYNIIVVDWTTENGFPYAQAVSNTRVIGAKLAKLVEILMEVKGVKPESIHMIGHSLGAHIAGYTAERIPNIGRITGLDPAGPYFRGVEKIVRLDTGDANFIDIIHSDGGEFIITGLGVNEPIGHQDFYPNGGRWQPGCSHPSEYNNLIGQTVNLTQMYLLSGCDHNIGSEYFLESIGGDCLFQSVLCTSYTDFEAGKCPPTNSTTTLMGFPAAPIPGLQPPAKFFLRTGESPPYCIENSIYL